MLEGLEISEIRLSNISTSGGGYRWDSEFYRRAILDAKKKIDRCQCTKLIEEISPLIQHPMEVSRTYSEQGYRILLAQEVRNNTLELGNGFYMDAPGEQFLSANKLERGDVVLTRSGANFGQCAPILIDDEIYACADLLVLRKGNLPAGYVSTFLNTVYGRLLLDRGAYGMAQPHIAPTYVRTIPIPIFSSLIEPVSKLLELADNSKLESVAILAKAEGHILHTLGLDDWKIPEALSYERSSREAFAAGRFDAEYFHPAKAAALAKLKELSDCTVGDLFNSIRELWQPDDDNGFDVVRNYDLTEALNPFLDGSKEPDDRTSISSTKKIIHAGDLVVSRLRSYLKEIALVQSGGKISMVASTEFIVLRPKQAGGFPVEALMVFLRSTLPQLVFKWSQDGSNHPRFDEKELLRLPVPRVLIHQASDYVEAVRAVISERERAAQLLNAAKRAVEIAIEQDEKSALAYLEAQTKVKDD